MACRAAPSCEPPPLDSGLGEQRTGGQLAHRRGSHAGPARGDRRGFRRPRLGVSLRVRERSRLPAAGEVARRAARPQDPHPLSQVAGLRARAGFSRGHGARQLDDHGVAFAGDWRLGRGPHLPDARRRHRVLPRYRRAQARRRRPRPSDRRTAGQRGGAAGPKRGAAGAQRGAPGAERGAGRPTRRRGPTGRSAHRAQGGRRLREDVGRGAVRAVAHLEPRDPARPPVASSSVARAGGRGRGPERDPLDAERRRRHAPHPRCAGFHDRFVRCGRRRPGRPAGRRPRRPGRWRCVLRDGGRLRRQVLRRDDRALDDDLAGGRRGVGPARQGLARTDGAASRGRGRARLGGRGARGSARRAGPRRGARFRTAAPDRRPDRTRRSGRSPEHDQRARSLDPRLGRYPRAGARQGRRGAARRCRHDRAPGRGVLGLVSPARLV